MNRDRSMLKPPERDLVAAAEEFARTEVAPHASEWERARRQPLEAIRKAAAIGLTRIQVPVEQGGLGLSFACKMQVAEVISRHDMAFAFALINTLAEARDHGIPELDLAGHSGGGLRDTTRIAASSPEMWRDIFLWNRDNLVSFIEAYERRLGELKRLIRDGDGAGIEKELECAKREREQLNQRPSGAA